LLLGCNHLAGFYVGDEFSLAQDQQQIKKDIRVLKQTIGSPSPPEWPAIFFPVPAAAGADADFEAAPSFAAAALVTAPHDLT
jgi:hypothetical protein